MFQKIFLQYNILCQWKMWLNFYFFIFFLRKRLKLREFFIKSYKRCSQIAWAIIFFFSLTYFILLKIFNWNFCFFSFPPFFFLLKNTIYHKKTFNTILLLKCSVVYDFFSLWNIYFQRDNFEWKQILPQTRNLFEKATLSFFRQYQCVYIYI